MLGRSFVLIVLSLGLLFFGTGCELSGSGIIDAVPSFIMGSVIGTDVIAPILEVIGNAYDQAIGIVEDSDLMAMKSNHNQYEDVMYANGATVISKGGIDALSVCT